MIIGTKRLLELVRDIGLVEGLCERELNDPEGAGFDFRVGEIFRLEGKGFLGVEKRGTPKEISVAKYGGKEGNIYSVKQNQYVALKTLEKLNLPQNMVVSVAPRTTFQRSGVQLIYSNSSAPGYSGSLTFGLVNYRSEDFDIELGARIALIQFHETGDNVSQYRGQWNGGRVSTRGELEKQV